MTEDQFTDAIVQLARTFGWVAAGFRPARTNHGWRTPVRYDGKGYPDLTLIHPERGLLLFVEVKTDTGRLSPDQQQWSRWLEKAAPGGLQVWRPRDCDHIAWTLSFGRVTAWSVKNQSRL